MLFMPSPYVRAYGAPTVLLFSLISLVFYFQDTIPVVKHMGLSSSKGNHSIPTHETALQHDPPPESPPYGALVIAAQNATDLSWTVSCKSEWDVYEYDVNRPDNEDPRLRFPKSKGNEAMVYLSFIIDHYDHLPWSVLFVHGHLEAWHQEEDILNLITSLDRISLARQGYISFRCDWYPSCPAEMRPVHGDSAIWGPNVNTRATEAAIAGNVGRTRSRRAARNTVVPVRICARASREVWNKSVVDGQPHVAELIWRFLFPEDQLPETIASPCCAQFAVTRLAILKRPKTDYERLRDWLMSSLLEDYLSGRVLEKIWAYIFTGQAVYCPPPEQCACEWFGSCGTTNWTKPPESLGPLAEWP